MLVLSVAAGFVPAAGQAAEVPVPAGGMRESAARHVAALSAAAFTAEEHESRRPPPLTCCTAGCRDAPPFPEDSCAGAVSSRLGVGLGLAVGSGLGVGLGLDSRSPVSGKEFRPFGLADSLITAGAAAIAWRGYKLVDREPPPLCRGPFSGCRDGKDVLGGLDAYIRREWAWPSLRGRATAEALSDGTLWATIAVSSSFLLAAKQPERDRDLLLTVESAAITGAILQVVKHRANRPRPYAHYCQPGCGHDLAERGSRLSFFSGHAALSFSFAVSAGTIASMRSYRNAGWVLGSGLALAAATSYFRIAADQHYFTDVLTGALVATAVGWAVPRLHGIRDRPPDEVPAAGRRRAQGPALVVPVPLRGSGRGPWLHGGIGGDGPRLALSWRF